MVLLTFVGLTAVEPVPRGSAGAVGTAGASPNLLAYASNYLHTSKSVRSKVSPHLQLVSLFIESLLPQTATPASRPVPSKLSAEFLAVMLDMWLTDVDMPAPAPAAGAQGNAPGLAQTSLAAVPANSAYTSAHFVPPMLLRTRCIKVSCLLLVWRMRLLYCAEPAYCSSNCKLSTWPRA